MRHIALDLANSFHLRGQPGVVDDELDAPDWLQRFSSRWSLDLAADAAGVADLRALRAALRDALAELTQAQTLSPASLDGLNTFAAPRETRSLLRRAEDGTLVRVETASSPASAADAVVRAFQDLATGEGARRLKLCANPLCRWAFFDESRNRSRRWCDSAECGNVMKVRAFRERQARETGAGSE